MEISTSNDVKIYDLSCGKFVPTFSKDDDKRKAERRTINGRRKVEVIQGLEMPNISDYVTITPDAQFIYAAGGYKPRIRCYEVNELSTKFERGINSDVTKLLSLSEDYSKIVMMQKDRWIQFDTRLGNHFRLRIPILGRDMCLCREVAELYMVGDGAQVYRLNLEEGRFYNSLVTEGPELNCCTFNDQHQLFVCGTTNGTVEAWDYRDRNRVGILNCLLPEIKSQGGGISDVTSIKFKDALTMAVGMSSGHVLLCDIRSSAPRFIKNHNLGLPITDIDFEPKLDMVMSMDSRALKMWNEKDGSPFTAIETGTHLNNFARYPDSGLIFFSNDHPKLRQFFVPKLGPAPKWCHYLESITEELEEMETPIVYQDTKFVTKEDLESVGLGELIGTDQLKPSMHGYLIDMRLYNRAFAKSQPFKYETYKQRKIREKLQEQRETKILIETSTKNLPKVNRELAAKLQSDLVFDDGSKMAEKKKELSSRLLADNRFKKLFDDPDYEVDEQSEQYKQIVGRLRIVKEKTNKANAGGSDDEGGKIPYTNEAMREARGDRNADDSDAPSEYEDEYGFTFRKDGTEYNKSKTKATEESDDESTGAEDEEEDDEEMDEESEGLGEDDEESEEEEMEEEPNEPAKPQRFRLVGLDSLRDFQSFAPNEDEDEDIARETSGTLGERRQQIVERLGDIHVEEAPFGGKTATFHLSGKSKDSKRKAERKNHLAVRNKDRRSLAPIKRLVAPLPGEKFQKFSRRPH